MKYLKIEVLNGQLSYAYARDDTNNRYSKSDYILICHISLNTL